MIEIVLKFIYIMLGMWLVAINIAAAGIVIYDKHISKLPRGSIRRIPEKAFVTFSALGGGFGTLATMFLIRHKTKSHDLLLLKIAAFAVLWAAILLLFLKYS